MPDADLGAHRSLVLRATMIVAAVVVTAGLVAVSLLFRPAPPCTARTADLEVYGAIWRVPARDGLIFSPEEKGPKLGVDYRTHPLTICGVRGYAPMRQADFGYDWQGLRGMAKEDPVRLGALADVDLLVIGHGRASALPNTTLGETFGPSMFGRPTVFSCRPLHDGAGREFPQCQLWGWAPGGVPVMLRYEDTGGAEALIRAVEAAVTAVRRDPR